jgi:hypothetical protein
LLKAIEAETNVNQLGRPLLEAIFWIAETYPEQKTPKRYGCGSWRHVHT